jgi:hypothetical protein
LKILLFLSFYKFHNVKITKPLKCLLSSLAILVSASSHHDLNCCKSGVGRINCPSKCSQNRILLHIALAKGQSHCALCNGPLELNFMLKPSFWLRLGGVWMQTLKFSWYHIRCYIGVTWGVRILIKNKLQIPSVNRETNLLRLINPSLAHVYFSTILSNHGLIRLKNSSRKLVAICVISYF